MQSGLDGLRTNTEEVCGLLDTHLLDHPSDQQRIRDMQKWVPMALAAKKAFDDGRIAPSTR